MSRVTAIISALVICIIVCLSPFNHYRDNAITYKAQRDKNARELKLANATHYWHADASAWCCCARCKIHEGVKLMLKLKMMLCVMMLPLVVVGCTSKQSVSQCVKPPPPPAWIMWHTGRQFAEQGLFHPQREAVYAKTTGRNQNY